MRKGIVLLCVLSLLAIPAAAQKPKPSPLEKQAKITRQQAEKTALAKVPNGKIQEGELEKEKGKLIWSFDIASPGSKDVTEVQVDAITGEVVSVTKESPAAEAAEKKKEAGKPKK
jgi:uncharacterized membrane protein YkoI